jgi:hypothetical protein
MEEDTTLPRRNDTLLLGGMRATTSSSMRLTEPQGRTEEPPVPPRRSTRSSAPLESLKTCTLTLRSSGHLESCSSRVFTCDGIHDLLLKCLMNLSRKSLL